MIGSEEFNGPHRRLPPDMFYWAVLQTESLPHAAGRRRTEQLGFLFERFLPVPIEEVQAVYVSVDGDRVLACGMQHDRLVTHVESPATGDTPITLAPATIPAGLLNESDSCFDLDRFNLLIERFEPVILRSHRRRWLAELVVLTTVLLSLVFLGVERRAASARATAHQAKTAIAALQSEAIGPTTGNPHAVLTAELRRLRQSRGENPGAATLDPTPHLASWLDHWPPDTPVRTESIVAGDAAMTIIARLDSNEDAQALIDAMPAPDGWRLTQPSLSAQADGVRVTLRAERARGGS